MKACVAASVKYAQEDARGIHTACTTGNLKTPSRTRSASYLLYLYQISSGKTEFLTQYKNGKFVFLPGLCKDSELSCLNQDIFRSSKCKQLPNLEYFYLYEGKKRENYQYVGNALTKIKKGEEEEIQQNYLEFFVFFIMFRFLYNQIED